MKSQIFEEIIDGKIAPNYRRDISEYQPILKILYEKPSDFKRAEELLSSVFKENPDIDLNLEIFEEIVGESAENQYTQIKEYYYPVNLQLPVLSSRQNSSPHERYYNAIIALESIRIRGYLIQYVNNIKSDEVSKKMIINVLEKITDYISKINNLLFDGDFIDGSGQLEQFYDGYEGEEYLGTTRVIYKNYAHSLVKLYFELVILFYDIIEGSDYLRIADMYDHNLTSLRGEKLLPKNVHIAYLVRQSQKAIAEEADRQTILKLLKDFRDYNIDNQASRETRDVILALDNYLYFKNLGIEIPSFDKLILKSYDNTVKLDIDVKKRNQSSTKDEINYTFEYRISQNDFSKIDEFYDKLVRDNYISTDNVTKATFRNLFRGTDVDENNKIVWRKDINELKYMFSCLKDKGIVGPYKGIWIAVSRNFLRKNGDSLESEQLRKTGDPNEELQKKIDKIIKISFDR